METQTATGLSGAVGGVDADVFGGEVACPVTGRGFAGVEMDDDGNVVGEKFVAGGAFVEFKRLAALEDFDAGHGDFDERGIEFDAGTAGGGEDAAPIGIAAGERGFDERRSGDGFGDFFRGGFGFGAADFDFDDALRAFAVGDDLLGERAANGFEGGGELAVGFGGVRDWRRASG